MLGDITEVARSWESGDGALDVERGQLVLPGTCPVDVFVAGFVFTTVSGENNARSSTTIATGIGSTGVTWKAVMGIISVLCTSIVLFEKVVELSTGKAGLPCRISGARHKTVWIAAMSQSDLDGRV